MAKLDSGLPVATPDLGDAIRAALDAAGDDTDLDPKLREAVVRLLVLRGRDVRSRLVNAGPDVLPLLKDEGFTAVEMNEAQVGVLRTENGDVAPAPAYATALAAGGAAVTASPVVGNIVAATVVDSKGATNASPAAVRAGGVE